MLSLDLRECSTQANSSKRKLSFQVHTVMVQVKVLEILLLYFTSHSYLIRYLFSEEEGTQIFLSLFLHL